MAGEQINFRGCGTEICRILAQSGFVGVHIFYILVGVLLSVTLFVYLSKLKFTYELEVNGLPWDRSTSLSLNDVVNLYSKVIKEDGTVDCDMVSPYCVTDSDCLSICGKGKFDCKNHSCIDTESGKGGVPNKCASRNGGVLVATVDGDTTCVCLKPKFYVGDLCEELNPLLEGVATISSDFDGLFDAEDPRFVQCVNGNEVAIAVEGQILCVNPKIVPYFQTLYTDVVID